MPRYLAHKVVFDGCEYALSVVEISPDGLHCRVRPFCSEEHSTRFVEGTVRVVRSDDGAFTIERVGDSE